MSQKNSSYTRRHADAYPTPAWVTNTIVPMLSRWGDTGFIWEPACGEGHMVIALERAGLRVGAATDIRTGGDFFAHMRMPPGCSMIVTNPPYSCAGRFIEHALRLAAPRAGMVAMLLRVDFDSGKTRRHLFADCPQWAKKVVLLDRIAWFTEQNGKPKASPSENHAWYVWSYRHMGPATIGYVEKPKE